MKFKKLIAAGVVAATAVGLVACGAKGGGRNDEITIGTWWIQYYASGDALEDSTDYTNNLLTGDETEDEKKEKEINLDVAQRKFDNVAKIEEKYEGRKFYWQNLTYSGVQDSINTSILAGSPDCDAYLVDTGMAIPAQFNGLTTDMKDVLAADDDLFTTKTVVDYLDLGDDKASILYKQSAALQVEATYPLAFNVQMLQDNNLEDPRDLYERGEWTWDKFLEYAQVLTQDTDGDGQTDQYGYCGYVIETFEQLMMSNGASIAATETEQLSSAPTGETLQMVYDMYNNYNMCYPYDYDGDPSNSMRNQYAQGNIGFFPIAAWIESGNNDYDWDGSVGTTLQFDIAYVRWPVGPSGNKETNPGKNSTAGEFYIIPAGVQEPEVVYGVLYDMWNWYDGDTSIRDNKATLNWWYLVTGRTEDYQNANFAVMQDCGQHTTLDLWQNFGFYYDFDSLTKGEMTAAQFQETYKQQVQDSLDQYFK